MTFTPPANDLPAIIRQMRLQLEESNRRRLSRGQTFEAIATSDLPLPVTTPGDIPGASVTFTTARDNAVAVVTCSFDWRLTATGTGYSRGRFAVDGTTQPQEAFFIAQAAETRLVGAFTKRVILATPGSHTIKLQGHKDLNAGSAFFYGASNAVTSVQVTLYD